jgi:hypothetical protein
MPVEEGRTSASPTFPGPTLAVLGTTIILPGETLGAIDQHQIHVPSLRADPGQLHGHRIPERKHCARPLGHDSTGPADFRPLFRTAGPFTTHGTPTHHALDKVSIKRNEEPVTVEAADDTGQHFAEMILLDIAQREELGEIPFRRRRTILGHRTLCTEDEELSLVEHAVVLSKPGSQSRPLATAGHAVAVVGGIEPRTERPVHGEIGVPPDGGGEMHVLARGERKVTDGSR